MENTFNNFKLFMHDIAEFPFLDKLSLIEKVDIFYTSAQQVHRIIFSNIERVSTKSSVKALEFKKSGNDLFCGGELIEALKCYTKCAAVSPPNSPELAFAYANRSAALYRLERYEACLVDINRALKENYPEASKPKLLDRKKNCLAKLREFKMTNMVHLKLFEPSILDDETLHANLRFQMKQCEIDSNSMDMNYEEKFYLPKVNFKNKTIANVSEKVGLKYSSEFGRHIVAKENIKPGEIISIEKPYASVLSLEKKYSHCANCFVKCESLIPCPNCSSALFCGKSCLQNAFNRFHRTECQVLSFVGYPVELDWLVIRLLMMATKQGKEIEALMAHPVFKNPLKKPTGEFPERFESQDFFNMQNLEDHLDKKDNSFLLSAVTGVSLYMNILKNTSFFDELCEENEFSLKEKERYLSHLLLKFTSCMFNAYTISERHESPIFPSPPPTLLDTDSSSRIGSALFSFHSLFNHACNANVFATFHKDVFVTRSVDPIKAGEQLFMNYGFLYDVHAREIRQKKLRETYLFTCRCTPCEENWPLAENLVSVKSEIMKFEKLYQCWKVLEERFAPGIPKHQHSAKLFNLLCEFSTLMHEKIKKPNHEYHEYQHRLLRMMFARGNYYEYVCDHVLYSL